MFQIQAESTWSSLGPFGPFTVFSSRLVCGCLRRPPGCHVHDTANKASERHLRLFVYHKQCTEALRGYTVVFTTGPWRLTWDFNVTESSAVQDVTAEVACLPRLLDFYLFSVWGSPSVFPHHTAQWIAHIYQLLLAEDLIDEVQQMSWSIASPIISFRDPSFYTQVPISYRE